MDEVFLVRLQVYFKPYQVYILTVSLKYCKGMCPNSHVTDPWVQQNCTGLLPPEFFKMMEDPQGQFDSSNIRTHANLSRSREGRIPVTPRTTTPSRRCSHLKHTQNSTCTHWKATFTHSTKNTQNHVCDTADILAWSHSQPHSNPWHLKTPWI